MIKIAGYYRLSMEDDDVKEESNSITNQRLLVKKYIAQDKELCSYEFCEFYDDGYSGTTMNRPGLQKMLEQLKKNEIQVVIVKDISRFSRDYIELGTYMEQIFPIMGIRFISITDHYDSRDYMGRTVDMDIAFKGLLADFYCKDVSVKTKSSLETKRKQGKYAMGSVPFGYAKDETDSYTLLIVPREAEIIRYIFQLSVAGCNLTQICKRLNDEKIMTPLEFKNLRKKQKRKELQQTHKFWQAGTVRAILTNESYIGNMVYDKSEMTAVGSGKIIMKPREEWKIYENHHVPIIEHDIFNKVQSRFNQKKGGSRKCIEYPLKGKVLCGNCKRTMKLMKLAGEKLYFYCANKLISSEAGCTKKSFSNEDLENVILEKLEHQLLFLADLNISQQELWIRNKEVVKVQKDELSLLDKKLQELVGRKPALLEDYHAGLIDRKEFQEKRNNLTKEIEQVKAECTRKKNEVQKDIKEMDTSKSDFQNLLCYTGEKHLTREMVEAFIERIEIDDNQIDIYWTFNDLAEHTSVAVATA